MKKFEYKIINDGEGNLTEEKNLNKLGQEGWELCAINERIGLSAEYIFKREISKVK